MVQPTLLIGAIFSLTSGVIYYLVGRSLGQREVPSPDSRLAWRLFIVWWYALAANSLATSALNLLAGLGSRDLSLYLTYTQTNILSSCAALYGLVYYLLFLFTGSRKILTPLTIFYILYYVLFTYYLASQVPLAVEVGRWSAQLVYQNQQTGPLFTIMLVLLVLPQLIGSVAYFTLFFRAHGNTQKYRIALVSGSIFIVFAAALIASFSGWTRFDWWQIASRLIGLGGTLAVLLAYRPTRWIKQKLGVISISEETLGNDRVLEATSRRYI